MLHYVFFEFIYDRRLVDILESGHVEDPLPGRLFNLYNLYRHIVKHRHIGDHGDAKSCSRKPGHGLVFFHRIYIFGTAASFVEQLVYHRPQAAAP